MIRDKIILSCESDTFQLAEALYSIGCLGLSIGLDGELGAGKTTFTRQLAKVFGSTDAVSSPTFVMCHIYDLPEGSKLEHWDLYRLKEVPGELEQGPFADCLRVIEWAGKFPELSQMLDLTLNFQLDLESQNALGSDTIRFVYPSGKYARALMQSIGKLSL